MVFCNFPLKSLKASIKVVLFGRITRCVNWGWHELEMRVFAKKLRASPCEAPYLCFVSFHDHKDSIFHFITLGVQSESWKILSTIGKLWMRTKWRKTVLKVWQQYEIDSSSQEKQIIVCFYDGGLQNDILSIQVRTNLWELKRKKGLAWSLILFLNVASIHEKNGQWSV